VERSNRVFSYSAEHEPCIVATPGETLLVETTNAFGDQPLRPGMTLDDLVLDECDTRSSTRARCSFSATVIVRREDREALPPGLDGRRAGKRGAHDRRTKTHA
jgi:hypothetical protein